MEDRKTTYEELARMISAGFEGVDKKFDKVYERFDKIEGKMNGMQMQIDDMSLRITGVEGAIREIKDNYVRRDEFEDSLSRTKLIEDKLGIESGK